MLNRWVVTGMTLEELCRQLEREVRESRADEPRADETVEDALGQTPEENRPSAIGKNR
jgi:hypothetical protein